MKRKKMIYTAAVGVILLAGLIGGCCIYQYIINHGAVEPKVITNELEREPALDEITTPEGMVKYILEAVRLEDLDMALRGNPIDEMGLAVDTEKIIIQEDCFYNDLTVAPSAAYDSYFPITSAELTGDFAEMFYGFTEELKPLGNFTVERIDYANPKVQNSAEHRLKSQQLCDIWGAEEYYELSALLSRGEKRYAVGFGVLHYADYWKAIEYSSELAGTTPEDYVKLTTDEEYMLICDEQETKILEEDWQKEIEEEELKAILKEEEILDKLIGENSVLLPPNYFVINSAYGNSPRDLMEQFVLCIQKMDMTSMLSYGYMEGIDSREHTSVEMLAAQRDFAIQLKNFYFDLLREKAGKEEKSLSELGETASEIVSMQSPENMFYLDLMEVNEKETDNGEYKVTFWYGGDEHTVECKFIETELGWQIQKIGDVSKIEKGKK